MSTNDPHLLIQAEAEELAGGAELFAELCEAYGLKAYRRVKGFLLFSQEEITAAKARMARPLPPASTGIQHRPRILFMCSHNSARSQMAEALLNQRYGHQFEAESAGLEPGVVNPLAIEAMRLIEIDISHAMTKSVFEEFKSGKMFSYVITVCDASSAERCPIFPGAATRIHWSFPDPSAFEGTWEQKLARTVQVRNEISEAIDRWIPTALKEIAGLS